MDLPDSLEQLAARQLGLLTRRQLLEGGVDVSAVRWRLGRHWRLLLPGVLLLHRGLPTAEQRLVAALLLAGPESWLAGPTAAALHGMPASPDPRVHVLVPAPANPRDVAWVSIRRTHVTDERLVVRGPLRWSSAARAVVDAAAAATTDDAARALLIRAVQERRVRLDDALHWVEARRPNGRLRLRRALEEAAAGAWSAPEADLLRLLSRSSVLPRPWANPELLDAKARRLTTPDVWFDDVGLAVMVHSRRYHSGALDWEMTVEQDSDLVGAGIPVLGVTPASIAARPAEVLARVEKAYRLRRTLGARPEVTATPRSASLSWGA